MVQATGGRLKFHKRTAKPKKTLPKSAPSATPALGTNEAAAPPSPDMLVAVADEPRKPVTGIFAVPDCVLRAIDDEGMDVFPR